MRVNRSFNQEIKHLNWQHQKLADYSFGYDSFIERDLSWVSNALSQLRNQSASCSLSLLTLGMHELVLSYSLQMDRFQYRIFKSLVLQFPWVLRVKKREVRYK